MVKRYDNGFTLIAIVSVTFAVAEWGSQGVKFGLSLLFVAFISFLSGEKWARGPRAINAAPRLDPVRRAASWVIREWRYLDAEKKFAGFVFIFCAAALVWAFST